jgi:hypothetical protein
LAPELRRDELVSELRRRHELDQAVRTRVIRNQIAAGECVTDVDDDNTRWLKTVVAALGWPGR